jgi:hypothetical protein
VNFFLILIKITDQQHYWWFKLGTWIEAWAWVCHLLQKLNWSLSLSLSLTWEAELKLELEFVIYFGSWIEAWAWVSHLLWKLNWSLSLSLSLTLEVGVGVKSQKSGRCYGVRVKKVGCEKDGQRGRRSV